MKSKFLKAVNLYETGACGLYLRSYGVFKTNKNKTIAVSYNIIANGIDFPYFGITPDGLYEARKAHNDSSGNIISVLDLDEVYDIGSLQHLRN